MILFLFREVHLQNNTMKYSFVLIRSTKSSSEIVSNEFVAVVIKTADVIKKIVILFMIFAETRQLRV